MDKDNTLGDGHDLVEVRKEGESILFILAVNVELADGSNCKLLDLEKTDLILGRVSHELLDVPLEASRVRCREQDQLCCVRDQPTQLIKREERKGRVSIVLLQFCSAV